MRNLLHGSTRKSALPHSVKIGIGIATGIRISIGIAFAIALSLCATAVASAQAMGTAQRGAEITPFVQTTLLSPDWGPTNNIGYAIGVDYTRFIRSIVQPSLELRMTSAGGTTVGERTLEGGLKLQTSIHGIRPFATFLVGNGVITFTHPQNGYLGDNSIVYSLGGGAEFNVRRQWKLRVDLAHQQWNLGVTKTLTPVTYGVGIAYILPFHTGHAY